MNKSIATNLIALVITLAGVFMHGLAAELTLNTGLYALSGGITNWLAIHMLFERVPGFYGSGVIPSRFTEFRAGIRHLVMSQFFNAENLQRFLGGEPDGASGGSVVQQLADKVDFNKAYDGLIEVIMQSPFAGMLAMVGGAEALKPLREPFIAKMQDFLLRTSEDPEFQAQLHGAGADNMLVKIENIVDKRLDELTPQLVKEIIHTMINEHLGWLVVWGGVVGGLIGLAVTVARL